MQHNLLQIKKSTLEGKISFYTYPQTVPLRGQLNSNGVSSMTQTTEGYYEVSADWLKATGNGTGESAQVFPVVHSCMAGHLPMVTVRLDDGREWALVASWRGRYVGKPEEPAEPEAPAAEPMVSKEDAVEIAHTYSWYVRDLDAGDNNGIYIYGGWLLSMQERMGIELMKPEYIRNSVERAVRKINQAD